MFTYKSIIRSKETFAIEFSEKYNMEDESENPMKKTIFYIFLTGTFLIGLLIRINYLNVSDYRDGADEGYYVRYGAYMAQEKGASIKALVDEYIRDKDLQVFPNPLRAGHILLSAWWMKAIGKYDFEALSFLSCLFSILFLIVGYLFVKKMFDRKTALFTLVLLVVSPLALAIGRRALQDSVVSFFIILSIYLFYGALKSKNVLWSVFFTTAFYSAVMIKETSILLFVFFVSYLLYEKMFLRKTMNIIPVATALATVLVATCVSYWLIAGGLNKFLGIVRIILLSPATNEYAIKYQSGNLLRYIFDFLLISPLTMVACVIFCIIYFVDARFRSEGARYLLWFFIVLYVVFSFFSKNLRYVMALDLPIRVFAALGVLTICGKMGKAKMAIAVIIIIIMAAADFIIFRHIFTIGKVYDPVTYNLIESWKNL